MNYIAITFPVLILFFILYANWVWNKYPGSIATYLIFAIEIVWGACSIVWIESGVYISEQLRYSFSTGASIRYLILLLPFLALYPLFTQKELSKETTPSIKFTLGDLNVEDVIWKASVLVIIYVFLDVIVSGAPLLYSYISKSGYYAEYSRLPFASTVHNILMPFSVLIIGNTYANSEKNVESKKIAFWFFLLAMLTQLLLGNKFYGLEDYVIWFFLPTVAKKMNNNAQKKVKRLPIKQIILILIGMGLVLAICYSQYAKKYTNPLTFLIDRIFALQSHTFWGVDLNVQNGISGFSFEKITHELLGAFKGADLRDSGYGIARVMYDVTTKQYADDMIGTGFLFAGSYMTVSLSYAGYILTFILSIIVAFFTAKVSAQLIKYLQLQDYIMVFMLFMIYRRIFEYFRVGSLALVLTPKMITVYILLIILKIICRSRYRLQKVG